ncbi:MAG TPA: XrtA system polysaccharide deacetylase [Methylomirabilota bacterium]|nr:XrtA system polysaccharide deacetylase [Methylomirabilota bacterium]
MADTRPAVLNALTVDVEEYYHGVEFAAALGADALARLPSRVVAQTERLLDLFDAHGARATFFTLGVVAQRFPGLVRSIVARGHELGSHGWDHTPAFRLGAAAFRADVRRAKRALESAAGRAVHGYRAPSYSIRDDTPWAFAVLSEEGHTYDSSVHPIAHDRYGFPHAPRFAHRLPGDSGLWEVPVGTARMLGTNLPVGGGFFRLFPVALLAGAIESVNRREGQPLVLYVHPWEFDPRQPRPAMRWSHRFRHYVGLAGAERKLRALLEAFRFTTIEDVLAPVRRIAPAAAA